MLRQQKQNTAAAKKAAAALRAQLHQELENKRLCAYQPHECSQLTLDGYDYCLRHIMEDKIAPYRQCSYVYNSNGKRCYLPAPKGDKKDYGYCAEHALKSHLMRVKTGARHQPANTTDTLLNSLSHYITGNRSRTSSLSNPEPVDDDTTESDTDELKATKSLNPFTEINAAEVNAGCSDILDYASESDSDVEPATFNSVWHDAHADSSDDESIDSEQEDVLKHAGIYTAEEVTLVTRDKLIRLQSLYIEQFKHLQHTLREKRRKYLHAMKREKETFCSIHNQPKDTLKEQRLYNKIKALNHYHRKNGIDALMNKKCTELRAKLTEGMNIKPTSFAKCTYSEGGVKCLERAMPVARHCRKHILFDPAQVLFKQCSRIQADIQCNEPVIGVFKDATCKFHTDFPSPRNYGDRWLDYCKKSKDEDSDIEDSLDTMHPLDSISHLNTPHSLIDIDLKPEFNEHYSMDMIGQTSSSESKTPPQLSSQLDDFSNKFPSGHSKNAFSEMKNILEIERDSLDYLKDVANALDGASEVDDDMQDISSKAGVLENLDQSSHVSENDLPIIDPDDDMAGIMLELQKDRKLSSSQESKTEISS